MAQKKVDNQEKPIRTHCPDCCFYLDGHKEASGIDGSIHIFPIPGMQHHRRSEGTIYDRIGTATPCGCATGQQVERGYHLDADGTDRHNPNGIFRGYFSTPVPMVRETEREF